MIDLKTFLKNIKLKEDSIKSIAKSLVIVFIGIVAINFFAKDKGQTIPAIEIGDENTLPAIHTVTKGEDLWNISERYYGSGYNWVDIAFANELANPNIITEGQELDIPKVAPKLILGDSPVPEPEEVAITTETTTNEVKESYSVQKGDSLWKIAEKNYNSGYNWVDIASANKLKFPFILNVGQEISIPKVEVKTLTVKDQKEVKKIEGDTYKVELGDSLWKIAVRAYGDGYKWPEIAKKNNLKNPGVIIPEVSLSLPR